MHIHVIVVVFSSLFKATRSGGSTRGMTDGRSSRGYNYHDESTPAEAPKEYCTSGCSFISE